MSAALTSWKEIAAYLGKSVRTVQRWEAELALPVRRPNQGDRNIVAAVPKELDEWLKRRLSPRATGHVHCSPQLQRMRRLVAEMLEEADRTQKRTATLLGQLQRHRRIEAKESEAAAGAPKP